MLCCKACQNEHFYILEGLYNAFVMTEKAKLVSVKQL